MQDFQSVFHRLPEVTTRSSGRVNLIGEHTDYNGGFVLPMSIPYQTVVEGAPRQDSCIKVFSTRGNDSVVVFELGGEKATGTWLDYIEGVTWALGRRTQKIRGTDLFIDSDIPMGSGLSSSAALSVALIRCFRQLFDLRFTDIDLAFLCRESENHFVGARVGIMDPLACLLNRDNHALFIDTQTLTTLQIPLPPQLGFIVMDTGVAHHLRGPGYNQRRKECEDACRRLGIQSIREVQDRPKVLEILPDPLRKRVRHVITENQRVLQTVRALQDSNYDEVGRLFYESHASMNEDYEVSLPEIDALVELCRNEPGIYGARLTGGGFGGSVVMAAKPETLRASAQNLVRTYFAKIGKGPRIWLPKPAGSMEDAAGQR